MKVTATLTYETEYEADTPFEGWVIAKCIAELISRYDGNSAVDFIRWQDGNGDTHAANEQPPDPGFCRVCRRFGGNNCEVCFEPETSPADTGPAWQDDADIAYPCQSCGEERILDADQFCQPCGAEYTRLRQAIGRQDAAGPEI